MISITHISNDMFFTAECIVDATAPTRFFESKLHLRLKRLVILTNKQFRLIVIGVIQEL